MKYKKKTLDIAYQKLSPGRKKLIKKEYDRIVKSNPEIKRRDFNRTATGILLENQKVKKIRNAEIISYYTQQGKIDIGAPKQKQYFQAKRLFKQDLNTFERQPLGEAFKNKGAYSIGSALSSLTSPIKQVKKVNINDIGLKVREQTKKSEFGIGGLPVAIKYKKYYAPTDKQLIKQTITSKNKLRDLSRIPDQQTVITEATRILQDYYNRSNDSDTKVLLDKLNLIKAEGKEGDLLAYLLKNPNINSLIDVKNTLSSAGDNSIVGYSYKINLLEKHKKKTFQLLWLLKLQIQAVL